MATRKFVIFRVNNESFAIDINQVNIIEKPMEIFKVPNTPDYVEGLINLRGKVHTVFNLRKKFGIPSKDIDDNTKIIIVNVNSIMVGLIVDEISEILTLDDSDLEAAPELINVVNKKYISSVAKKAEQIIMVLDVENIISLTDNVAV